MRGFSLSPAQATRPGNQRPRRAAYAHQTTVAASSFTNTTASVVVTTYGRPGFLAACLDGLRAQARAPDEIVVVVHDSDVATDGFVAQLSGEWPALRRVAVQRPGLVAALNRGLAAARGEIVAFVDDDAVPTVDWLRMIVETFERDDTIAGVGGRDLIVRNGRLASEDARILGRYRRVRSVGRIQWFGRQIGNHHIAVGRARDVDVLKGVNMSFRRRVVAGHGFDARLRGRGVESGSEQSICLPLRRRGLRLVYDPAIVVRHYPAARAWGDQRESVDHEALRDAAHNDALAVLDHFGPAQRLVFTVWSFTVGTSGAPGLAVLARQLLTQVAYPWPRFVAAQAGLVAAWRTYRTPRPALQNTESQR